MSVLSFWSGRPVSLSVNISSHLEKKFKKNIFFYKRPSAIKLKKMLNSRNITALRKVGSYILYLLKTWYTLNRYSFVTCLNYYKSQTGMRHFTILLWSWFEFCLFFSMSFYTLNNFFSCYSVSIVYKDLHNFAAGYCCI